MIPFMLIAAALKPYDIQLPPERYRSTQGPIIVLYVDDPRTICHQHPGQIGIACTTDGTLGHITILPLPEQFRDEPFARSLIDLDDTGREAKLRTACKYTDQVYSRLACHEIEGHQLGRWPANHPK